MNGKELFSPFLFSMTAFLSLAQNILHLPPPGCTNSFRPHTNKRDIYYYQEPGTDWWYLMLCPRHYIYNTSTCTCIMDKHKSGFCDKLPVHESRQLFEILVNGETMLASCPVTSVYSQDHCDCIPVTYPRDFQHPESTDVPCDKFPVPGQPNLFERFINAQFLRFLCPVGTEFTESHCNCSHPLALKKEVEKDFLALSKADPHRPSSITTTATIRGLDVEQTITPKKSPRFSRPTCDKRPIPNDLSAFLQSSNDLWVRMQCAKNTKFVPIDCACSGFLPKNQSKIDKLSFLDRAVIYDTLTNRLTSINTTPNEQLRTHGNKSASIKAPPTLFVNLQTLSTETTTDQNEQSSMRSNGSSSVSSWKKLFPSLTDVLMFISQPDQRTASVDSTSPGPSAKLAWSSPQPTTTTTATISATTTKKEMPSKKQAAHRYSLKPGSTHKRKKSFSEEIKLKSKLQPKSLNNSSEVTKLVNVKPPTEVALLMRWIHNHCWARYRKKGFVCSKQPFPDTQNLYIETVHGRHYLRTCPGSSVFIQEICACSAISSSSSSSSSSGRKRPKKLRQALRGVLTKALVSLGTLAAKNDIQLKSQSEEDINRSLNTTTYKDNCNKIAVRNKPSAYIEVIHGRQLRRPCAPGTLFSARTCTCSIHIYVRESTSRNEESSSSATQNLTVDSLKKNSKVNSYRSILRQFASAQKCRDFGLYFEFRDAVQDNNDVLLLASARSNDHKYEIPTFQIVYLPGPQDRKLLVRLVLQNNGTMHMAMRNLGSEQIHRVWLAKINDMAFFQVDELQPVIRQKPFSVQRMMAPLVVRKEQFGGLYDKIKFYRCVPENFFPPL